MTPHVTTIGHCEFRSWSCCMATCVAIVVLWFFPDRCSADELRPEGIGAVNYEQVGEVSADFRKEVRTAWDLVPPAIGKRVLECGWKIKLTTFITEAVPELDGVQPRGWPDGATWNNTDAVHLSDQRILVFAEKRRTRDGRVLANNRVAGVLGHEVGHAFDLACFSDGRVSSTTRFRHAYQSDIKAMPAKQAQSLAYYLQGTDVGRQESFAEAFALITGNGSDVQLQEEFRKAFPTVMKTMRSIVVDNAE